MMKKLVYLLMFSLFVNSCNSEPKEPIAANFGGEVNFGESKLQKDENSEALHTYMIKVRGSKMLDSLHQPYACATIAIMAYNSFTEAQKEAYPQLYVEIQNKDAAPTVYYFNSNSIANCAVKDKLFAEFSKNLINGDYEAIAKTIIPKYRTPTLGTELGNFVRPLIKAHGDIETFKRTHFSMVTTTSKKELYKFEGVLLFEDGYERPFYITTSSRDDNDLLSGYQLDI